jgi:hypothetical protein
MNVIAGKAKLLKLRGKHRQPSTRAVSTFGLLWRMAVGGVACGVVWHVALALGVSHLIH